MRYTRLLIGTLVTVGLLAALWVSPASAQPGFSPPGLDVAIAAQERHTDNLLRIQGVVGTAIGLGAGGQPVVKIYTERAGVAGLPRSLDGVPVVVQVTGKIFALHHRDTHCDGPPGSILDPSCGGQAENNLPQAVFTTDCDNDSRTCTFDASASSDPDEDLLTYVWDFGDGSVPGSVVMPIHIYDQDGPFTVVLTVTDPGGLSDTATDEVFFGEVVDPKDSFTLPVPIGVSSGSERLTSLRGPTRCTVGTLGARLVDSDGILYALSANHIYAQEGEGVLGIDRILQPGRVDMTDQACGSSSEINNAVIGTLHAFVPIEFSRRASNIVDAAVALVSTGTVGTSTLADGYGTPSSTTVAPTIMPPQPVQKYGRTTSLTMGTIDDINATIIVRYDSGQARFVGQIAFTGNNGSFSQPGDSGSLIVTNDENKNPVALLFAGSDSVTFGNPIGQVLDKLAIELGLPTGTLHIDGAP